MSLSTFTRRESPVWQIVEYLQRQGSATIKELEELLGITTTAVRQHLNTLQAEGYIERRTVHAGVGRPHHAYFTTDKVQELFACHCDDLALTLLEEVFHMEGSDRASQLLERVGTRLARKYALSLRSSVLQDRVSELAGVLNGNGVLADALVGDDDTILLRTYNCPFHELAQGHREICEMDRELIGKALGSDVNLSKCMMEGHAGCTFVVGTDDKTGAQNRGDTLLLQA
ncbi:MAG: DeoR family transcriptional regulator [Caldilineaceae bacterium]|nr:DeoR family transcriptional regulator [Caldilineaceae bacterium]